jgi:polysaccharide pyruvyl transferase WcaK-like protein
MINILNESGHERNRNAGDEAYFATMVSLFKNAFDNVRITAFSDRPDRDRNRYGVSTVYSGGRIKKTLASIIPIVNAIRKCDVYVWGAGQILRDDGHIISPLYRLSRPLLAKLFGKKVMAYGVGIGPLETQIRTIAKHILNRFDLITYRDPTTGKILLDIGVHRPEIYQTVDPAFGLEPADEASVDRFQSQLGLGNTDRPMMGVAAFGPAYRGTSRGVQSILFAEFKANRDMWQTGGKENYIQHVKMLAKSYDYVVDRFNANLVFIVQDTSGQGLDDRITRDIIKHMRHHRQSIIIIADDHPPALLKGLMGRMALMTGGRMHSLILACGQGTPLLGMCYENKIKSFGKVLQQEENFIDAYNIQRVDDLNRHFNRVWENRVEIRNAIEKRMQALRSEVNRNVERLRSLIES